MALASDRAVADNTRFITSTWLATIALITYDYLLTFSDEVHYIWARGSKPTKIIFAVCRYSTIVTLIMTMSVCDLGLARIESAR
ncbi:hypothetical protein PsYK624_049270 [Phanerochaete sordida]|uniref:DUF6533 domain-containing protein n=1 Tax=Phanerochaete sordida TaxID=48140 RepID=A0A9P3LB41_9APHY|nr:hypothetical protein PsYK624_049270 [Phanerochaete sordida]